MPHHTEEDSGKFGDVMQPDENSINNFNSSIRSYLKKPFFWIEGTVEDAVRTMSIFTRLASEKNAQSS